LFLEKEPVVTENGDFHLSCGPKGPETTFAGLDSQTQNYYLHNAKSLAEQYQSASDGVDRWFETSFPKGSKILDIGCAAGRDVSLLLKGGWDAWGVDPCNGLINEGLSINKKLNGRLSVDMLPALSSISSRSFDGVLCSAVLMHIPEEHLFDAAFGIRRVLKPGGRVLISLPVDRKEMPLSGRDNKGRFHNGLAPEKLELLLIRLGFTCIGKGENADSLGRTEKKWIVMLFSLTSDNQERSIDRIESVLNRDRKVATYKLALFRALAEIGMTQYNKAIWIAGGVVGVPIRAIAEKWLEYYWPIVSSDTFISQKQGERANSQKPIAFRKLMQELISVYRLKGGLSGFLLAVKSEMLKGTENKLYEDLIRKLIHTIRVGPVAYSGGGGTANQVFGYDCARSCITMNKDIWQEFCLMGSWVRDATILRWAELTERISKQETPAGKMIGILLEDAFPERDVTDARNLFKDVCISSCVWTGVALSGKTFHVDHAIPYSLWRCNDLWNLFPVSKRANLEKKDKLPSRRLVLARKQDIVQVWEISHQKFPARFAFETASFSGESISDQPHWPDHLFSLFSEAVEVTSIQRGAERWEP